MKKTKKDYSKISSTIIEAVGGKENIIKINNCISRLRLNVKNKDLINSELIKSINVVKGLNWNGDELQIIIGGEVTKVRGAVDILIKGKRNLNKNSSLIKRGLQVLNGIVSPIIPVLIISGLLYGLQSILSLSGAINTPKEGQTISDVDPFSAIVIVSSSVGLQMLGVFFSWSIARYYGGNQIVATLIALSLCSHMLLGNGGYKGFNDGFLSNDGNGWKLFSIAGQTVYLKSIYGTVLPFVGATAFYLWFDWLTKKWMPVSVDTIFRPFISFIVTILLAFFLISPLLGVIEQIVGIGAAHLLEIPFGIGSGLLALLMQPIVLLGGHLALFAVFLPQVKEQIPTLYVTAVRLAELAQVGALIGVIIRTKNISTKKDSLSFLFPAFLGVTEPVIYGVNLQKGRPIIFGCIGAGIAGVLAGILNLKSNLAGFGFLGFLGFDSIKGMLLFVVVDLLGLLVAFLLTFFLYVERPNEAKSYKKMIKKIFISYKKNNKIKIKYDEWQFKKDFDQILELIIENKQIYLSCENSIIRESKLKSLIKAYESKKNNVKLKTFQSDLESISSNVQIEYKILNDFNNLIIEKTDKVISKINLENKNIFLNNISFYLNSVGVNYLNENVQLIK